MSKNAKVREVVLLGAGGIGCLFFSANANGGQRGQQRRWMVQGIIAVARLYDNALAVLSGWGCVVRTVRMRKLFFAKIFLKAFRNHQLGIY